MLSDDVDSVFFKYHLIKAEWPAYSFLRRQSKLQINKIKVWWMFQLCLHLNKIHDSVGKALRTANQGNLASRGLWSRVFRNGRAQITLACEVANQGRSRELSRTLSLVSSAFQGPHTHRMPFDSATRFFDFHRPITLILVWIFQIFRSAITFWVIWSTYLSKFALNGCFINFQKLKIASRCRIAFGVSGP
jgi:hypothetical protein